MLEAPFEEDAETEPMVLLLELGNKFGAWLGSPLARGVSEVPVFLDAMPAVIALLVRL